MSGMDRLTVDDLEYWEEYGDYEAKLMARELLARRRASQAAPAPADVYAVIIKWIEHGDLTCDKVGALSREIAGLFVRAPGAQASPAPSDGLREADRRTLAMFMANAPVTENPESYLKDFIERIDTDVIAEMLGRPALTHPGLISRDEELAFGEMLRRALDYAVEQCAALSASPAQEGGE